MLELSDLHKRYGEVVALNGASFSVRRGALLGFLGPNGAGKTTAMRAIFGLIQLDSGGITWDGREVGDGERLRFGYMPEQRGLYPKMTVVEQLTYFGRLHGLSRSEAQAAAERWVEELGVAPRAKDRVETLSHGNQQRVQLAAALVHEPELLVLDEPFSGLDPLGVDTMAEVLRRRAAEGTAVVFSSHQLDLVEDLCEEVAVINRGRVVLAGRVDELKGSSPHRILEVEVSDDGAGLLSRIDGVVSATFDGRRHRLLVEANTDVRKVLAEAQEQGSIRHFIFTTPSLSQLFREAVA